MHAVLTGDIVNSTLLAAEKEKMLMADLEQVLSAAYTFEFFRGDSFQAYFNNPESALKTAMQCRAAAIALMPEDSPTKADVRISIGLGDVQQPIATLATAKGTAFLLSGRTLDELGKSNGKIVISTENKLANVALTVMSDYINSVFGNITQKQAEVIRLILNGMSQQQVAEMLNKSKSTISQHVTAGRWDELERILLNYQHIVQLVSL